MLIWGERMAFLKDGARAAPQQVFATVGKVPCRGKVAIVATMFFGDKPGRTMERQQPMKMAAAEAIYNTERCELLAAHYRRPLGQPIFQIRLPHVSVLATTMDGRCRA